MLIIELPVASFVITVLFNIITNVQMNVIKRNEVVTM